MRLAAVAWAVEAATTTCTHDVLIGLMPETTLRPVPPDFGVSAPLMSVLSKNTLLRLPGAPPAPKRNAFCCAPRPATLSHNDKVHAFVSPATEGVREKYW